MQLATKIWRPQITILPVVSRRFITMFSQLHNEYPWTKSPLVVSAPMLWAATPTLAANVTKSGGIGFIAGGSNAAVLDKDLTEATTLFKDEKSEYKSLPIGVGFQVWTSDVKMAVEAVKKHSPAIIWLFAPKNESELSNWSKEIRAAAPTTKIWIQVGTLQEAQHAVKDSKPDVLILQGSDAGGHGLVKSASIISLIPEVVDWLSENKHEIPVLAAGGIVDGRGVGAALALGASGAVMGTRFLAASEAGVAKGWQRELIRSIDGGVVTGRSTLCDRLKETKGWPTEYDGRAILNKGHDDEKNGMSDEENVALYKQEVKQGDAAWGPSGRMVTYAGTAVGLIRDVRPAAEIVQTVISDTRSSLQNAASGLVV